jgi:dihydropteroate synthase
MFKAGKFSFPLGQKTYIMGILNYTPDSFSDGGKYNLPQKALSRGLELKSQGADIIDLGANSTRPGANILDEKEELKRLKEVFGTIENKISAPISVDTFYPTCAEYALNHGAVIINDVSGTFNNAIAQLVKEFNGAYIVTHNPCGADNVIDYPNGIVFAVREFFDKCINSAQKIGLNLDNLCLDIGLGFGKTNDENYELVRRMNELKYNSIALLAGASRKRITNIKGNTSPEERDIATGAIHSLCIMGGADIIRVHNVPMAVEYAGAADAVCRKNG